MTKEEAIKLFDELQPQLNEKGKYIALWKDYYGKSCYYPNWLKDMIKEHKKNIKYLDKLYSIYKGWI